MIEALPQWILHSFSKFVKEREFFRVTCDRWNTALRFYPDCSFLRFTIATIGIKVSMYFWSLKRIKDLFYIKSLGLFNLCKERTLKIHQFQDVQNIFKSIYNVWKYQFFTWGNSDMRNRQRMTIRSLVVLSVRIFRLIRLLVLDTVLVELTWGKSINEYF